MNDDIHDMMARAHYAEIREARLRIEVDRLKAENARLRADAERYRWICRFPEDADYEIAGALNGCDFTGDGPSFRDLLSDAIDAALSAVPNNLETGKQDSLETGKREAPVVATAICNNHSDQ